MRGIFSISNFKSRPALLAVMVILVIEVTLQALVWVKHRSGKLEEGLNESERAFWHVDEGRELPPVIFVGDSSGSWPLRELGLDSGEKGNLTSNFGLEPLGQYYLVRRIVESGRKVKALVYMGLNPFGLNLDGPWTEIYFNRSCLRWQEIAETFLIKKDIGQLWKMIGYKLSFTWANRLSIQLIGPEIAVTEYADIEDLSRRHDQQPMPKELGKNVSDVALSNLIELGEKYNFTIYYLFMPRSKGVCDQGQGALSAINRTSIEAMEDRMRKLVSSHSNFIYVNLEKGRCWEDKFFADGIHLNQVGISKFNPIFRNLMTDLGLKSDLAKFITF